MNELWPELEKTLPRVARPSRYINGEHNCAPADVGRAEVSVCLIYPDTYEVGMSNLGLGILYEVLAGTDGVAVDRAFAPWPDMEAELRNSGARLFGLASEAPLSTFDVLGVTLQYEMTFTNILTVLDLAGVPVRSAVRDDSHPLVIGGGPCAANPEPVAPFFDAIVVGDGEEAVVDMIDALREAKSRGASREELLLRLASIDGLYVPAFYEPSYKADGTIADVVTNRPDVPGVIRRRIVADLDKASFPAKPIVPFADVVHDRLSLEIMRGCTRGCRFCQAGMTYRPVRERDAGGLIEAARRLVEETGYEDLSLVSLSSCDYSRISELVQALCADFAGRGVSLSLPSGRVDAFSVALARSMARLKKTGLTFAPEAGTQRLRDVINKQVSQEDFERTVREAFSSGWRRVKLYFMVGLPTETRADVEGIADTVAAGARVAREAGAPGGPVLNLSISCMVPKAQSPFQWAPQDSLESLAAKQQLLRAKLSKKVAKLHWHDAKLSVIEGVLARGDRRLADVIESAWRAGCRLDAWSEHFRFDLWADALAKHGLSVDFYSYRRRADDEVFPWRHILAGPSTDFLLDEWHRAQEGRTTPDCRANGCTACGICGEAIDNVLSKPLTDRPPAKEAPCDSVSAETPPSREEPELHRLRFEYRKAGRLRFLSHLEVCRAIERAARRADLPVAVSEGFSPKLRISYGPALPVGTAGLREVADVLLTRRTDAADVVRRLDDALPDGLDVIGARYVDRKAKSVAVTADVGTYEALVSAPGSDIDRITAAMRELLAEGRLRVESKGRMVDIDLAEVAGNIQMPQNVSGAVVQRLRLYLGRGSSLRPDVLLAEAVDRAGYRHESPVVTRTGLFAETAGELVDLMEVDE